MNWQSVFFFLLGSKTWFEVGNVELVLANTWKGRVLGGKKMMRLHVFCVLGTDFFPQLKITKHFNISIACSDLLIQLAFYQHSGLKWFIRLPLYYIIMVKITGKPALASLGKEEGAERWGGGLWNHRPMECFELEGHLIPTPCREQGHLPTVPGCSGFFSVAIRKHGGKQRALGCGHSLHLKILVWKVSLPMCICWNWVPHDLAGTWPSEPERIWVRSCTFLHCLGPFMAVFVVLGTVQWGSLASGRIWN